MPDDSSREPTRLQQLMGQLTGREKAAELAAEMHRQGVKLKDGEQVQPPAGKRPDWMAGNREHRRILTEEQGAAIAPAANRLAASQPEQAPVKEAAAAKRAETLEQLKAEAKQVAKEAVEKQAQREVKQQAEAPKKMPPEQQRGGRRR